MRSSNNNIKYGLFIYRSGFEFVLEILGIVWIIPASVGLDNELWQYWWEGRVKKGERAEANGSGENGMGEKIEKWKRGGKGRGEERERERFVMFHYKYHRNQEASWASFIFHNMLLGEPAFPAINHLLFYRESTSYVINFLFLFLQRVVFITSFNMLKYMEDMWRFCLK